METNNRWYVRRKDGKKDGSFSDAELAALISKGIVEPEERPFILEDTEVELKVEAEALRDSEL